MGDFSALMQAVRIQKFVIFKYIAGVGYGGSSHFQEKIRSLCALVAHSAGEGVHRLALKHCVTRRYQRADNRCYAVENRNEEHCEQYKRVGLPHKHKGVEQPIEKTAEQLTKIAGKVAQPFGERHFFIFVAATSSRRRTVESGSQINHHLSESLFAYIVSQFSCECNRLGEKS